MNGKSHPVLLRRSVDLFCVGASQVSSLLLDLNWLCSLKVSRYSAELSPAAAAELLSQETVLIYYLCSS